VEIADAADRAKPFLIPTSVRQDQTAAGNTGGGLLAGPRFTACAAVTTALAAVSARAGGDLVKFPEKAAP
jgi:hypothetical protein